MSDETDTTGEVARVLVDHTRPTFDGKCHCGFQGRLGESFTAHQAAMLAEAGLLRAQHEHSWISDRALCSSVDVQRCASCGATREIENEEGA